MKDKSMPKLIAGNSYFLEYRYSFPTRTHQSGFVVERETREAFAEYEYIRCAGGKYHFYDNIAGLDIYLDKTDFLTYWRQLK